MKLELIWKMRAFFLRGWSAWLTFVLSLIQFLIIAYLEVQNVGFLNALFPNLWIFSFVFVLIFVPLCVIVGWWDYRKGSYHAESNVGMANAPYNQDIAKALILICEGKTDEAKEVLKKWTKSN